MPEPRRFAASAAVPAILLLVAAGGAFASSPAGPSPAGAIRATRRAGLPARAAALLLSDQSGGDVALSVLALPVSTGPDGGALALVLDLDAATLLAGLAGTPASVEVTVYAATPAGAVVAALLERFDLDPAQVDEARARGGIKVLGSLAVPAGPIVVRVLARRPESASFGLVETSVVVPAGGETVLAPPVIDEPDSAWLLVVGEEAGAWGAFAPAASFLPASRPVLPAGVPVHGRFIGRAVTPGAEGRLRRSDGSEAGRVQVRIEGETPSGTGAAQRATFVAPAVEPGPYTLELTVGEPGSVASLPVVVVAGEQGSAGWPLAAVAAGRATPPVPTPAAVGPAAAEPPGELRVAYLEALAHFTAADGAAAEAAVAEIERAVLRDGRPEGQRRLLEAELGVARELFQRDGDALLALLRLHTRLAATYGAERAAQPQAHAWMLADELAALTTRPGNEARRARAADAMACLSGSSQRVGAFTAAESQQRVALLLDADNGAALEGLAASLERRGQYREAEDVLVHLVARRPESAEARLRLALARQRRGEGSDVESLLRSCTGPGAPDWVQAVAWQELVQRHAGAGEWEAAAGLLRAATAAFPHDRELATLHAFVLDRSGHRSGARAIAERLLAASSDAESARFTYSRPTETELASTCTAFAELVAGVPAVALERAIGDMPRGEHK